MVGHLIKKKIKVSEQTPRRQEREHSSPSSFPSSAQPASVQPLSVQSNAAQEFTELPFLPDKYNDQLGSNIEHIKLYLRKYYLHVDAQFKIIYQDQLKILRHFGLEPTEEVFNQYRAKFDSEGYLLDSDGERLDPTEKRKREGQ